MEVLTLAIREGPDVPDVPDATSLAEFACPDLTTFCRLDVGGHEKLPGDGHEAARWRS